MIAIIDYGMGNLRSVQKGFEKMGFDAKVVQDAESIQKASGLVLPGVGAFKDCIHNLSELRLVDPILEQIQAGKPYLGICLGLQILFTESDEFGRHEGLNLIPGKVVRFDFKPERGERDNSLKIPHMGWNTIRKVKDPPLLQDVPDQAHLYFVHSYYVVPENPEDVATTTHYGLEFTSMVWKDNIFAMQFHPEKSQEVGLSILRQFGLMADG